MFACPLCPYRTPYKAWLTKHAVVHETERPFACDVCSATFKTMSALNLHRVTHTEPTFHCGVCSFVCKHKRTLDRHLVIHADERPHECPYCCFKGRRKQDVRVHMRCMHSGKPRRKRKEEDVAQLFDSLAFPFYREFTVRILAGPRKRARLDFKLDMPWGWLVFEVDEMQHSQYPVGYECFRMTAIYSEFSRQMQGRHCLHIVRYNPDPWRQGDGIIRPSCDERKKMICAALAFVPDTRFAITYLFYRGQGEFPDIIEHPEFSLKQHVLPQNRLEDISLISRAETT